MDGYLACISTICGGLGHCAATLPARPCLKPVINRPKQLTSLEQHYAYKCNHMQTGQHFSQPLEIAQLAPAPGHPAKTALDDPAFGQDRKTFWSGDRFCTTSSIPSV
jgi:hypothetical protein